MSSTLAEDKSILVTGGSGLVGRAIQWAVAPERRHPLYGQKDCERWVFLSSRDGDLRDYQTAKRLFDIHRPNEVIHLAAHVGGLFENSRRPADFLANNLAIDQNILRLCHEFKVSKLVSCLSTCIFPDTVDYPINETMLHAGPPHTSNFAYAYAKRMLEVASRAYRAQYGCNFTTIIPTNIYGPHDNFSDGCHVIPGIIKRVTSATNNGDKRMHVPGTGKALRQFIYSRDLARLIVYSLRYYDDPTPLILSVDANEETSIKQVLEHVCDETAYTGTIIWDPTQSDGQLRKTADNSRLKALLPEFQFTSLVQGRTAPTIISP